MNRKNARRKCLGIVLACPIALCFSLIAQSKLSVADIVAKNIQAAGGRERLAQIKNISFRTEARRFFVAADGTMKTVLGFQPPVSIEALLLKGDKAERNFMNQIAEITGNEKSRLKSIARFYGGAFTLANFAKHLAWQGVKTYGPVKFYCLTAVEEDLQITFYIDVDEYLVKRIIFSGSDKESGKFEFIHEYDDYKKASGIRFPAAYFTTQVGVSGIAASNRSEISDIIVNPELDQEFYSRLEINAGEIKTEEGTVKGNILSYEADGKNVIVLTNCTPETMMKTGFKSSDRLLTICGGKQVPIVFYATQDEAINAGVYANGTAHMTWDAESGNLFYIFFTYPTAAEATGALASLSTLMPIEIKKIKQGE